MASALNLSRNTSQAVAPAAAPPPRRPPARRRAAPCGASLGPPAPPAAAVASSPAAAQPFPSSAHPGTPPPADSLVVTSFRWPAQLPGREVSVVGSFNNWSAPVPLQRMPGGDWVRSLALPPGPLQFKFLVDGTNYEASPCEHTASDGGGAFNNHRLVHPTAELRWPSAALGGREVLAAGSWSSFGELLPLARDPATGDHVLQCCLPPGSYFFQFLVDGAWRLRPDVDAAHTADGHFANVLQVAAAPAFRVFYATGWTDAVLRVRRLDAAGAPLHPDWREAPLRDTPSRARPGGHPGSRWVSAVVPADGAAALEFLPASAGGGGEDRAPGGAAYVCPHPGGYKLAGGALRPFPRAAAPPVMLVADLDGTMVGEGPEADAMTAEFAAYWEGTAALAGSLLVYNTGRSLGQFCGLLAAKAGALPVPDALICAVGTKVFLLDRRGGTRGTAPGDGWVEDAQWARILDDKWDLRAVRAVAQAVVDADPSAAHWLDDGSEHPHRVALSVRAAGAAAAEAALRAGAAARGLEVEVITSGEGAWRYVDCVSARGGKLAALEYVRALFGVERARCLAAGDSGNDALMLGGDNPAVVVGNAQPELLQWVVRQPQGARLVVADAPMARGVMEGLARHGLY
jgi:sucrose-6F-phosphate phosphohydrolase